MIIHSFYYNDNSQYLNVEFSLKSDDDNTYRSISLFFDDVEFYSPTIIDENDMNDIDDNFVIELLEQYFIDNEYPEERFL